MKQTFVISGRLPGYNELQGAKCWQASRRIKQDAMNRVLWAAKLARVKPVEEYPVTIQIECMEPNKRRDQDNVQSGAKKVVLDALQQMGVLANDNQKHIADIICPKPSISKDNPRVEVTIWDNA